MSITLEEAIKLSGVESWTLTPPQKKFLIESRSSLLERHPKEWPLENQERLKVKLEMIFKDYLP